MDCAFDWGMNGPGRDPIVAGLALSTAESAAVDLSVGSATVSLFPPLQPTANKHVKNVITQQADVTACRVLVFM